MLSKLSKREVIATLGVSERTLENWVREKYFPTGIRIGKEMFWLAAALENWEERVFKAQLEFLPGFGALSAASMVVASVSSEEPEMGKKSRRGR